MCAQRNIENLRRLRLVYFILLLFCFSGISNVRGDSDRFTASVNPQNVSVGDQFQITFTLNGGSNARGFKAPSFGDFNVLMGPSQSSNMQIINGSFSQSISITYVLQAQKEGTFKIGGAEIMAGNDRLISNTVSINVGKSRGNGGQNNDGATSNNVFLKASVDKSTAYRGEAIVVTYRLYTRVTLLNYTLDKLPSLDGFWSQEIELPQQPEFHNENVDGVNFKVAEIKKLVLFPQRSGSLEIDPMRGEVIARVQAQRQRNNDPFNQFFNDPFFNNPFFNNTVQDVKVPLKSSPLRINVKELPSGAPATFSGAVGRFACEVSLDKSTTKTNDAVTLKIKITGKGNIKLVDAPSIDFPPDMETYEPKESIAVSANAAGVSGTKTFEYLIIPRTAGDYKLPVSPFSYFDLDKKQYVEIPSPELSLHVEKGNETVTTTVSGVKKSDLQLLGKDIRFIKTSEPQFEEQSLPLLGSGLFFTLLIVPALLFGILLYLFLRHRSQLKNVGFVKQQRASKTALKRLSAAKSFMDARQRDKFLDELFRALWGFVSDKLGIPVSDLSKETAGNALRSKGVPEELVQSFISATDNCEFARFAGNTTNDEEALYHQGLTVITQLEEQLKS